VRSDGKEKDETFLTGIYLLSLWSQPILEINLEGTAADKRSL